MKFHTFSFFFLVFIVQLSAQKTFKDIILRPKGDLVLKIKGEGGKNGAGVAFDPNTNRYYAAMAGNKIFPLEVFDKNGRFVCANNCENDIRGFFYNPEFKTIEGSLYESHDIITYKFEKNGKISSGYPKTELFDLEIEDKNVCLNYDSQNKKYIAFNKNGNSVTQFNIENGEKEIEISLKIPKTASLNYTSIIYLDIENGAYGLLDYIEKKVLLFSPRTGNLITTIQLPKDALTNDAFRFAYTNDRIFLFDADNRIWNGYKIFENN